MKKLISLRIEEDTLDKIKGLCQARGYQSDFIREAINEKLKKEDDDE